MAKTPAVLYLHWPLCVSQLMSSEVTPGLEQLHISHPTRGWQPNVWGSQVTHSGCRVRGGQMHSPVTGSHRRVPQLHAREKTKTTSIQQSINPTPHHVADDTHVCSLGSRSIPWHTGNSLGQSRWVCTCTVHRRSRRCRSPHPPRDSRRAQHRY